MARFCISFVYVQGMALTYTLLGLIVAAIGLPFQVALQHPYVMIGFINHLCLVSIVDVLVYLPYSSQAPYKQNSLYLANSKKPALWVACS